MTNAQLLTVPEVAARLGIGRTTLYLLLAQGDLPSVRIGRRRLIREDAIEDFIRALSSPDLGIAEVRHRRPVGGSA